MRFRTALLIASVSIGATLFAGCQSNSPPKPDPEKELAFRRELALRYYDLDDLLRAEEQAGKGLEIQPDDTQLKLLIGWIRQRRGTKQDLFYAEKIFRELQSTDDYRAILGLGESLEREGVLAKEAADKIESGERVTDATDPKKRIGELRAQAKASWVEALDCFKRTLAKKDGDPQAINGTVRVYGYLGDYDKSLSWSDKLIAQSDQELVIWKKQLARPDLTASEERRVRDLVGSTEKLLVAAHEHAASILVTLDRRADALQHIDSAIALSPDTPELHSRRGQLLHDVGRYDDAVKSLEQFVRISTLPFEDPDIRRAYTLMDECKALGSSTKNGDTAQKR